VIGDYLINDHLTKHSKLKIENSKLVVSEAKPLKVAVLAGGVGHERDVSIQSGQCVVKALKEAKLSVIVSDISPDNMDILEDDSIDIFFVALHGEFGEDGQLQQILEDKSLLYTGSDSAASKLAFDKMASKKAFSKAGIKTPAAIEFDRDTDIAVLEKKLQQLADKYVVKPVKQGSTIGVSVSDKPEEVIVAAQQCLKEFGNCMIEEFVPGREITVGVLCGEVLPIIELQTQTGFYDYEAKYFDEQTEFLFDTIEDPELVAKINTATIGCFDALGCRHFARVDLRLCKEGTPYALELNSIPGLTTRSDLPKAAEKAGFSTSQLCMKIIEEVLKKDQNSKLRI